MLARIARRIAEAVYPPPRQYYWDTHRAPDRARSELSGAELASLRERLKDQHDPQRLANEYGLQLKDIWY